MTGILHYGRPLAAIVGKPLYWGHLWLVNLHLALPEIKKWAVVT